MNCGCIWVVRPLNPEAIFTAGSGREVIPGNKVVELREGSVVLEKAFEGSTEVFFFVILLYSLTLQRRSEVCEIADVDGQRCIFAATGTTQQIPMRPKPGMIRDDHLFVFQKMQGDFQKARKAIIIGTGPVGWRLQG